MKTSSKQLVVIAGFLTIMTIIAIAATKHDKTGKVTFRDSMTVIIHPGTNISKPDEKALNDVLKHYDKSVYRIETYQKGKRRKTKGELIDMYIDKATAAEVADSESAGRSIKTIQCIGLTSPSSVSLNRPEAAASPTSVSTSAKSAAPEAEASPTSVSSNKPKPSFSPTSVSRPPDDPRPSSVSKPPKISEEEAKELVKRIKPILEKYSK